MAKRGNGTNGDRRLTKVLETADQKVRGSQAWTSIFRPGSVFRRGYTDSPRNRSYVIMNNVLYHLHPVKVKRHAVKVSYTLCLGGLSFFLFILLTITGIFLMFFYRPTAASAWDTVQTLETAVTFGSIVRNMHRWAAHLMVLTVFLHMSRVFYHGAYKSPREFNWVIGVILLTLTLLLSFTGYLLRLVRDIQRHALTLVHVARVTPPVRDRDLHGRPLLARPQGRRPLRAALEMAGMR